MELRFLGGAREVGRSAVLVNDALLLDFGMLAGNPPRFPVETPEPDAVVVSHGHLDHVGAVPSLLSGRSRPPIHWTPPTYELALTLARDTLKLRKPSVGWKALVGNRAVLVAAGLLLLFQGAFTYLPFMNTLFRTQGLSLESWGPVLLVGLVLYLVVESEKAVGRRRIRRQAQARG